MKYKSIDPASLHEAFSYDAETGVLEWKARPLEHFASTSAFKTWNKRFAGKEAGTLLRSEKSCTEYRMVKVYGCMVLVHLIIWAMHHGKWPESTIDHTDLNGCNNRIDNLREATQAEQLRNRPVRKDNTSGKTGVSWHSGTGTWYARISIDGREVGLGNFHDFEDALAARVEAEKVHGYRMEA